MYDGELYLFGTVDGKTWWSTDDPFWIANEIHVCWTGLLDPQEIRNRNFDPEFRVNPVQAVWSRKSDV